MSKLSIQTTGLIVAIFLGCSAHSAPAELPKITKLGNKTVDLLRALVSRPNGVDKQLETCISKFKSSKASVNYARIIELKESDSETGILTSYSIMGETDGGEVELFITPVEGGYECEFRTQSKG
jgi:hypothetical protein